MRSYFSGLLEEKLESELNRSRRGPFSSNLTERAAGGTYVRDQELGMVQGVEPVGPELGLKPFLDREVLDQHHIQVVLSVLPDSGEPRAEGPEIRRELLRRNLVEPRIGVEPFPNRALAP